MSKGNGTYTNEELVDSLITDCNNAACAIVKGEYVLWCGIMHNMAQKLICLRNGLKEEEKHRVEQIESLKSALKEANTEIEEIPIGEFTAKEGNAQHE